VIQIWLLKILTPKGLNVLGVPNEIWALSLDLKFF
jgi:hypothetical protein